MSDAAVPEDARLVPVTAGEAVWQGRPEVGVRAPDVKAGVTAFAATFAVLAGGLALVYEAPLERAAAVGGIYAGIVALVTTLARAVGAGLHLTLLASFLFPVAVAAALEGQSPGSALCSSILAGVAGALVVLRFRQRRATRYLATTERITQEGGAFTITFPIRRPPRLLLDRFGASLGDVEFDEAPAQLRTEDGKVFRLAAQARRLHRVREPQRLAEVLRGAASGSEG